ncbi:hypothetical protein WMY93_012852 [Mugilogobius chulae]|uniref:Uncharacterized protein n=1 Tax=Mugilogobius chulae TaxID=88201 RepID=A0AAW0P4U1_9GOBI
MYQTATRRKAEVKSRPQHSAPGPRSAGNRRQATGAATGDSGDQRGTSGPTPGQRASRSSDSKDFDVHKESGQDNHDTPRTTPGVNRAPGRTDTNQSKERTAPTPGTGG